MKLPNKLIAIDLETTDVDAEKGDIIQIGAVIVNEDLTIGDGFNIYIKPLSDHRDVGAMMVNGISEEILASASTPEHALEAFEGFAIQGSDDRPMLAAWGAYFDIPFLETYYKRIGREYPFSYKSFDLKSVAIWEMAKRGEAAHGGLSAFVERLDMKFIGKKHDALDDILMAVRVVQKLIV